MITPGTLASPLSFWCLDAKGGESSTRFFEDLHWKEHKLIISFRFLCLCSCIFSYFETISLHGVRHVQLLFLFRLRIVISSLFISYHACASYALLFIHILAWFTKCRGSCDPNQYAFCIQTTNSLVHMVRRSLPIFCKSFVCVLSSNSKKEEIERAC